MDETTITASQSKLPSWVYENTYYMNTVTLDINIKIGKLFIY